jgi:hypothetical protein
MERVLSQNRASNTNIGPCALKKPNMGAMNMCSANGLTAGTRPMSLANIMATSNIKDIVGESTSGLNPSQPNLKIKLFYDQKT